MLIRLDGECHAFPVTPAKSSPIIRTDWVHPFGPFLSLLPAAAPVRQEIRPWVPTSSWVILRRVSPRSSDPVLAELARRIEGQGPWSGRLEDVPVEVHHLIEALIGVFESLCTTAELLLVIDNLHWADGSSLAMLRQLSRLCRQYPALILVTTRPSDKPAVVALIEAVLDLGPLDPESVLSLAGQLAGGLPGPQLADRVARAAGNPLFVVELLSTLVQPQRISITSAGHAEIEGSGASASLAVSILHRLSLLPADSIELLRAAAICGRTVDMAELSMLANRNTLAMAESLRGAAQAGIVETSGDRLLFRHELIHDALYQDWPLPVRRSLHRELAERLAASGAPALHAAARWATGIAEADAGILLEDVKFQRATTRPFDLAMVQEDAAAALARDGRLDRARDLIEEALARYDALLARQRSAAARARLRALGLQLGSTGRRGRPAAGWKALTNAELQVFQLGFRADQDLVASVMETICTRPFHASPRWLVQAEGRCDLGGVGLGPGRSPRHHSGIRCLECGGRVHDGRPDLSREGPDRRLGDEMHDRPVQAGAQAAKRRPVGPGHC